MNIAPKNQPRSTIVPIVMHFLTKTNPDSSTKKFKKALGDKLVKSLILNWKNMPSREKYRRYNMSREWYPPRSGNFAENMAMQSKLYVAARQELISKRKQLIKKEVDRAMEMGVGNYKPSASVVKDKTLLFEVNKWLSHKFYYTCRCESPDNPNTPPAKAKFGVKVTKLKCHDQRETGHDEIYLISTAVDGNGNLVATTSNKLSIDDDDDDVLYPNYYIYPMQDPGGFLDIAIAMWEDDGGYGEAAKHVAAIGSAVATIPNPYTVAAGVALQVIGGLIGLASWLDDDDHYGDAYQTWPSLANLQAGVGSYIKSFYEVDTGWFDDGHDFDLTINLLTA